MCRECLQGRHHHGLRNKLSLSSTNTFKSFLVLVSLSAVILSVPANAKGSFVAERPHKSSAHRQLDGDGISFCDSTLCTSCTTESADPLGSILGDYCTSLMGILKRGSTNVIVQNQTEAKNNASTPYLYIPPFESLAFSRTAMTFECKNSASDRLASFNVAYGIDTSSLSLAATSAQLVCQTTSSSLVNFLLNSPTTGNKVQASGCEGYSYFGYIPAPYQHADEDSTLDDSPLGGLRDCYTVSTFSNTHYVPNLFAGEGTSVLFSQGQPSLKSTMLKGIALLSMNPAASVEMFQRLYPALSAMALPGVSGTSAFGMVIEYPNSTTSSATSAQPLQPKRSQGSNPQRRRSGESMSIVEPDSTFFPGPTVRTLTKTLEPPTTSEEESTTPSTETTTTETDTTTTSTTAATSTTTEATSTSTTTQETTENPSTTTQSPIPPTTTETRFKNSIRIDSQILLFNWANLLMQQSTAPIPSNINIYLQTIAAELPEQLQPYLCQNVAGMKGFFPRQLFVSAVGGPNNPSQGIVNGYQTIVDTTFDSYAQFTILAALGSKGLALSMCKLPEQGTLAVEKLLSILSYLAIRDPSGTVTGMAASDPTTGIVDYTRVDTIATSLAIIAIQQTLSDLEDTDNASPQRLMAQSYLDQLRSSIFMTSTNCIINYNAFWPVNYNTSFGNLMAMAGPADQCGGVTPSLGSTALWLAAVSGSNPFRLVTGLHPVPPNNNNNEEPWFETHRILFLSVSGCIIVIVVAAVAALVVANVKRNRRVKAAEEERRALVNPQVVAAGMTNGRTSERENKKNMGFF